MGALQQDTAAISAQRCISLYLERLGCTPDAASPRLKVRPPADPRLHISLCAGGPCFDSSPAKCVGKRCATHLWHVALMACILHDVPQLARSRLITPSRCLAALKKSFPGLGSQ